MRTLIIARDEILRLLSTRRGLFSLLGCALIWAAVLKLAILPAAAFFDGARDSGLSDALLPRLGLSAWQQWPTAELSVYWACSLYLLPFMALIMSADQTASDRARGTLRFLVLRSSRMEILLGRFLGQIVLLSMLILLTLASVLLVIASESPEALLESVARAPLIVSNLILLVLPYIALMALVSVLARSARQATLYAMVIWISVSFLVGYLQSRFGPMSLLDWILPGSQIGALLRLADWRMLEFAAIPLLHAAVLLALAAFMMQRRDL